MLKFISFGSGSSGNCYYLATSSDALIIDAGVGVRMLKKYMKEYGLNLHSVHYILITHDHADHIKTVGSISHELGVPVYCTEKVHDGIDRNYCVARKIANDKKHVIQPQSPIQLGDFMITPFHVPHDSSDNVGFFIEASDTNFCIMTDAGEVTEEMKGYIKRAHYLVIEANHDVEMLRQGPYPLYLKTRIASEKGHLCNSECGRAIAENMSEELRHVWLCHLSEENNHPELARKTVESVLRQYGIIAGKDIQLDILRRKLPTGVFELV